jgi:hypothetical protein
MSSRVEKLIESGAWAALPTPTEKLITIWFAAKYPNTPMETLFTDIPKKEIVNAIGSHQRYVNVALGALAQNTSFINVYKNLSPKRKKVTEKKCTDVTQVSDMCQTDVTQVSNPKKEKGKEEERKFSPQTPFIKKEGEKGKESVCADGTLAHSHDAIQSSKQKKQQQQEVPSVVLREPQAFNRFYQLYPKKSKMRQEKEKLKRLWHQCELDGWPGDVIVQALEAAIRSERWTEKEGLYKPNAFKFLEEELMRDFLPIGYAPTPLVDASEENAESEAHPGMIYKLGVWWTPEELQAYADSMIIPERLKGKVQI